MSGIDQLKQEQNDNPGVSVAEAAGSALYQCAYAGFQQHAKPKGNDSAQAKHDAEVKHEAADVAKEKFGKESQLELTNLYKHLSHEKGATADSIFAGLRKRGVEINAAEEAKGLPEHINLAMTTNPDGSRSFSYLVTGGPKFDAEKTTSAVVDGKPAENVLKVGTFK